MTKKIKEFKQRKSEYQETGTRLTQDEVKEIIHLIRNNHSLMEIGKHYDKSSTTIYRIAWKYKVKRKNISESLKDYRNGSLTE